MIKPHELVKYKSIALVLRLYITVIIFIDPFLARRILLYFYPEYNHYIITFWMNVIQMRQGIFKSFLLSAFLISMICLGFYLSSVNIDYTYIAPFIFSFTAGIYKIKHFNHPKCRNHLTNQIEFYVIVSLLVINAILVLLKVAR